MRETSLTSLPSSSLVLPPTLGLEAEGTLLLGKAHLSFHVPYSDLAPCHPLGLSSDSISSQGPSVLIRPPFIVSPYHSRNDIIYLLVHSLLFLLPIFLREVRPPLSGPATRRHLRTQITAKKARGEEASVRSSRHGGGWEGLWQGWSCGE